MKTAIRPHLLIVLLLGLCFSISAQSSNNPFDLTPRLPATVPNPSDMPLNPFDLNRKDLLVVPETEAEGPNNPFDIQRDLDSANSPFEIVAYPPVETPSLEEFQDKTLERLSNQQAFTFSLVFINVLLLIFSILLFRGIYTKAWRAVTNANMMSQLYRERFSGAYGQYLIAYFIFFIIAGSFLYLTARELAYIPTERPWLLFFSFTAVIFGALMAHHLLLNLVSYIYPVEKESRLYSFSIMVFSIFASIPLVVAIILIAYLPESMISATVWVAIICAASLLIWRCIRGLSIGSRFAYRYTFHFLLYLCTVEIIPVLLLYKLISNAL